MPAPFFHLALTEKLLARHFTDMAQDPFVAGTLFPDIRYLRVAERDQLHPEINSISEINPNDPFLAGMQFHSLVDSVKQRFNQQHDL